MSYYKECSLFSLLTKQSLLLRMSTHCLQHLHHMELDAGVAVSLILDENYDIH